MIELIIICLDVTWCKFLIFIFVAHIYLVETWNRLCNFNFLHNYRMRSLSKVPKYCRQNRSLWLFATVRSWPSKMSYMQNRLSIQVFGESFIVEFLSMELLINIVYVAGSWSSYVIKLKIIWWCNVLSRVKKNKLEVDI